MIHELVKWDNKDLVARFTNGRFTLRIPKPDSSVDEDVRRFLDEEAVKLLDVLGREPLLCTKTAKLLPLGRRYAVFGILKIRLSKQVSEQTPHFSAE